MKAEAPGSAPADDCSPVPSVRALELEDGFRNLVEAAPEAVLVHVDWVIVYANPAAARLLALSDRNELIGRRVLEFVHPDEIDTVRGAVRARVEQGKDLGLPETDWVRRSTAPWCTSSSRRRPWTSVGPVRSSSWRAHDRIGRGAPALAASEVRFRSLVATSSDVIVVLDEHDVITYASPALERVHPVAAR